MLNRTPKKLKRHTDDLDEKVNSLSLQEKRINRSITPARYDHLVEEVLTISIVTILFFLILYLYLSRRSLVSFNMQVTNDLYPDLSVDDYCDELDTSVSSTATIVHWCSQKNSLNWVDRIGLTSLVTLIYLSVDNIKARCDRPLTRAYMRPLSDTEMDNYKALFNVDDTVSIYHSVKRERNQFEMQYKQKSMTGLHLAKILNSAGIFNVPAGQGVPDGVL